MKRILPLLLALLLMATFVACDDTAPETPTETPTEATTEAPTETPTEAPTEAPTEEEEEITLPATEAITTGAWSEPEDAPYDRVLNTAINSTAVDDVYGYNASGEFNFDEGDARSTAENSMFIVTNDRMAKGKLTATFVAPAQYVNDNGIIFGMTEDTDEQYFFWEDGPTYYFLFVSDDCTLYLAKVSSNGQPWTELQVSSPIWDYEHGESITISVEFDGEGVIDCYANGELIISYFDYEWSGGSRYGIRCEVPGVSYLDVVADQEFVPEW